MHWRTRIWITLAIVLAGVSKFASGQSPMAEPKFQITTPVSQEFQDGFQAAQQTIPIAVWRRLARSGWRVCLAEFVIDAAPELDGRHPRGWPSDTTWNNTDAAHLSKRQLLVFAEKRRNRKGEVVATHRVPQVLRHEVGHAFDAVVNDAGGLFSSRADFRAAHARDLKQMPIANRKALAYFAQSGQSGRQETFAEAFAILLGGGSDSENGDCFTASFTEVMKLVEQALKKTR
ncbi:MAG: hypothetical protein IH991_13360 [Planctomycetes bacterium]|nr:hypothetical protein [Planctomycetota bacterium]